MKHFWIHMTLYIIALYGSAYYLEPYFGNWLVIPYGMLAIGGFILLRTKLRDDLVFRADVWLTESFLMVAEAEDLAEEMGESSLNVSTLRLAANARELGAEILYTIAGTKERRAQ